MDSAVKISQMLSTQHSCFAGSELETVEVHLNTATLSEALR